MGTWGLAISSNDTYADIFSEFMDLYDDGLEPSEISTRIINQNTDLIENYEDQNNFWFALAMAQWQCKSLDPETFQRVKTIIQSGKEIKIWEELRAEKKDISMRIKVLDSFLEKLSTEKDKPRKRKRKVFRDSIFEKGDCLIFRLANDNFGGAFVLTSEKQTEYGMNMIAITTLNQKEKPTINDFKNAFVLIRKEQFGLKGYQDREMVSWYYAQFFKKSTVAFEIVGKLKVAVDINDEIALEIGKPKKTLKLSKLRTKYWL